MAEQGQEQDKEHEQQHEEGGAAPAATEAADESQGGEADLRRELDEARARADEYHRSWQRSAADFANYKRRQDEDKRYAERWLIGELLPILDDFERAWMALPNELRHLTWLDGVLQINSKLFAVLQRHGVTPIEAVGKDFNPIEHEAVMREDDGDPAEQTAIVAELQRGYRLHERVLRPSLVKVGKPKPEAPKT